jgi:hypothetical protein
MRRPATILVICLAAALLASGCQLLRFVGGSSGSPQPEVTTGDQAAQLVLAKDTRFAGLPRRDPNLIGQGSWWDVAPSGEGFEVSVQIGWGDCEAGCISRHTWVYAVTHDATVTLVSEGGDPLPAASQGNVSGRVVSGPTCPVESSPPDPQCAARPVAGATLGIGDSQGKDIAVVVSDADGAFSLTLPAGDYVLVAQPVAGLMGTPAPISFTVVAGSPVQLTVGYDTGIR